MVVWPQIDQGIITDSNNNIIYAYDEMHIYYEYNSNNQDLFALDSGSYNLVILDSNNEFRYTTIFTTTNHNNR